DTRLHGGRAPLRIAYDRAGNLPPTHHLLDDTIETWIFGPQRPGDWQRTHFQSLENRLEIPDLLQQLAEARKSSLLVEGGALVLQQFLDAGAWDEIRVITGPGALRNGVVAPRVPAGARRLEGFGAGEDWVEVFHSNRPKYA
ncbi:MAG: dihydrofolate reductase family protein, partial [Bacteroidota bacterium]